MESREYGKMFLLEPRHWWFVGKRSVIFSFIRRHYPRRRDLRVLDVGCGTGINMRLLQRYGEVFGVDVSNDALTFCRQRGLKNVVKASVTRLPFNSNSFDVVLCADVLYHKDVNDLAAVSEIFRVLKPGGHLFVTDSAMKLLWSRHDVAVHAARRYSAGEMRAKLKSAGFTIEKLSYMNFFLFPFVFVVRKLNALSGKPATTDISMLPAPLNFILKVIFRSESLLLPFVDFPFGVSVFAVARKPLFR